MQLWKPQCPILQKLAASSVLRQRLILIRQQLLQPINEQECFIDPRLQKQLVKSCQSSLKSIEADLKNTNKLIDDLIQTDEQLKKIFSLVTSVPGIGYVTELIIATEEFNTINSPKKLACHAGVAPFEYRPGSSVRGKTRINEYARKRLKSLFHLAGRLEAAKTKC